MDVLTRADYAKRGVGRGLHRLWFSGMVGFCSITGKNAEARHRRWATQVELNSARHVAQISVDNAVRFARRLKDALA